MSEPENIHLRFYIERILDEREKALVLTAKNLERRLDELNNLRSEVVSDRQTFLSKSVYDVAQSEVVRRLSKVEADHNRLVGIAITLVAVATAVGFMAGKLLK